MNDVGTEVSVGEANCLLEVKMCAAAATPPSVITEPFGNLTIEQAKAAYTSCGGQWPFRLLLRKIIEDGARTEFDNDSYLDALFLTELMLERSKFQVRILSGPQADSFLSALRTPFEQALNRVAKTNGFVRIILLGPEVPLSLRDLQYRHPSVLSVALAKSESPVRHFIVCDTAMARFEEIHGELQPDTPAREIKAKVYFNDPDKSRWLEGFFDSAWTRLKQATAPL
jgi:hypothetical protein